MNQQIRDVFDKTLPEREPPHSLNIDQLLETGSRRVRRRRAGIITAASVTAIIAVATLVITNQPTPQPPTPPGLTASSSAPNTSTPTAEVPVTLPQIDPDLTYMWTTTEEAANDFTKEYSTALQEYLTETYPGFEASSSLDFARWDYRLDQWTENSAIPSDHHQPLYGLSYETANGRRPVSIQFPDSDQTLGFAVKVWPQGSFTEGTTGFFDLAKCEESRSEGDNFGYTEFYPECSEATGPDEEMIRNIRTEGRDDATGKLGMIELTTVLYRADGTAVTVSLELSGPDGGDMPADLGDTDIEVTYEELADLALALPDTAVE